MNITEWLDIGINNNWIGPPICYTHDGLPTTPNEDTEFDEGYDPCITILRIYNETTDRTLIEQNHTPTIWRNHNRTTQ